MTPRNFAMNKNHDEDDKEWQKKTATVWRVPDVVGYDLELCSREDKRKSARGPLTTNATVYFENLFIKGQK